MIRLRAPPARPLICRTHGLPIRFAPPSGRVLPVIDACPKNFVGEDLHAVDAASVLDQTTLSTVLAALDMAHADEAGWPRGQRAAIAEVLAEGDGAARCGAACRQDQAARGDARGGNVSLAGGPPCRPGGARPRP
ncbi:hypothetical protein WMF37_47270 [Sorangium sp. So ce291]|uniref:hypothetical protein n=1 Tax=Sorangium sp. So ce291 TaxID=3133294 RepID=UPI003F640299